ncbi:MAG: tetratricopeptide repeat protein [Oligoflexia bacterium]|nr:tetratricopeptide repeat protein [Oligoflexia bacterium]
MGKFLIIVALLAAPMAMAANRAGRATSEKAYFAAVLRAVEARNYPYGKRVLEYLVRVQPGKGLYWFNLGNVLFLSGDQRGALAAYRKVVDLGSPLAPVAWLYSAKCYRGLQEYSFAARALALANQAPLPPRLASEAGAERAALARDLEARSVDRYRAGDYDGALRSLQELESLSPLSAEAHVLRGLCLTRKGEGASARAAFRSAAVLSRTDRNAGATEVRQLLSEQSSQAGATTLQLGAFSGYDDNIYADGESELRTAAPVLELTGSVEHELGPDSLLLGSLQLNERVGLPAERFLRIDGLGATSAGWGAFRFYLYPRAGADFAGSELFATNFGLGFGVETGESTRWGVLLSQTRTLPFADEVAYLFGNSQLRKVYVSAKRGATSIVLSLTDQWDGGLDLSTGDGILPMAGRTLGPSLSLSWSSPRFELGALASYFWQRFDRPAWPENALREDRRFEAQTRFSWRLRRGLEAHFSVNYVRNRSTLGEASVDDKNYAQWLTRGGISWQASW